MNIPLLGVGVVLIAVVMWDVLVTTLAVGRPAGPVTGRVTHALWKLALRGRGHSMLAAFGVGLTLLILVLWLLGLWAGWSLVFNAGPAAVVDTAGGEPAGFWQRVYFAGYTLFTLGNGEFRPDGVAWQLATVAALVNGLALATLGITYLVPVTSAASQRRSLATLIAAMGDRPDDMVALLWTDEGFSGLHDRLALLEPRLSLLTQQHLAYPVLHYFHSPERSAAAAPMIARLDEAVTLVRSGVASEASPPDSLTSPAHSTLTRFLDTLRSAFIEPARAAPPAPSLARLRDAGVPTVDDETFRSRLDELSERRRLLLAFIRNDGWTWDDVWPAEGDAADEGPRKNPETGDDGENGDAEAR